MLYEHLVISEAVWSSTQSSEMNDDPCVDDVYESTIDMYIKSCLNQVAQESNQRWTWLHFCSVAVPSMFWLYEEPKQQHEADLRLEQLRSE